MMMVYIRIAVNVDTVGLHVSLTVTSLLGLRLLSCRLSLLRLAPETEIGKKEAKGTSTLEICSDLWCRFPALGIY